MGIAYQPSVLGSHACQARILGIEAVGQQYCGPLDLHSQHSPMTTSDAVKNDLNAVNGSSKSA